MEKILNYFKNKSVGYWILVGVAALSLIFGIIYMATYTNAIGNNADGMVPETVGIYMLAGSVIAIVACVLPQYKFITLIAVLFFGLSLYKEVFLIPDFIAGLANNVEYNGGNARMNIFYLVMQLIIIICATVSVFLGYYKNTDEENADFNNIKNTVSMAKIGGGAAAVLVAVLVSTLVVGNLKTQVSGGSSSDNEESEKDETEVFNPITDEIRALAADKMPDNDPKDIVIEKEDSYDFSDSELTGLSVGKTRDGHTLAYLFEGAYSEGYQGNYNEYYTNLYLWDDGLYTGKSNSQTFKGYWYNDADGDGETDCLNMVSGSEKYASLVTSKCSGFYCAQAYVYMNPGWGDGRSIIVSGYLYYECVALAIDTTGTGVEFKKGDMFQTSEWTLNRILANLSYGAVFNTPDGDSSTRTTWTVPSGLIVDGKLAMAGEFEIKASWGGFETSVTITVTE